jgi:hypothetical protein
MAISEGDRMQLECMFLYDLTEGMRFYTLYLFHVTGVSGIYLF